jgi:hypothetical protein
VPLHVQKLHTKRRHGRVHHRQRALQLLRHLARGDGWLYSVDRQAWATSTAAALGANSRGSCDEPPKYDIYILRIRYMSYNYQIIVGLSQLNFVLHVTCVFQSTN